MSLLHFAILIPFVVAAAAPLFYKYIPKVHTGWFVLPVPLYLFVYFLMQLSTVRTGDGVQATVPWIPSLDIAFTVVLDGLSLIFALLITGIGALVVLYSIYYLDKDKEAIHRFYLYLLLFMGAMLGVVLSDNLVVLYGFWELTSLSSFLLIAFWYRRTKSRYGAQKSMLITVFGGFAMLAGIILLYLMTGTFSIREIIAQAGALPGQDLFLPAMILLLIGAFTKSAQFPFHIWLPDAMEAPTPVSSYLHSATMVKAGLYLVARLTPVFGGAAEWFWLVSAVGLLTLLWGSVSAIRHTDLKAILAFSTISQLGLIMTLLGLGSAALYYGIGDAGNVYVIAITAAVFHLINHATFKGALFMVVGIVDHETGTRDIRYLGGLMTLMPVSFTMALIGTFSMAGIPPFNGFLSKEMFFTAVLHASQMDFFSMQTWGILFPVLAWIASVFTFIYSMIIVFKTFTGKFQPDKLDKTPHEAPVGMLISPVILVSLVVVFGLFPNILSYTLIEPAMASILPSLLSPGDYFEVKISMWHGWQPELFMTLGIFILGTLLYLSLRSWRSVYQLIPEKWSLNHLYDSGLKLLERGSLGITRTYMTGSIRQYFVYIFGFFAIILLYSLFKLGAFQITADSYAEISVYEVLLLAAMIFAAVAIPFVNSRLTAIILLGAVGYLMTTFFVVLRAPDLALTQMIVETVSVTLFLLCFYHLPKLKKEISAPKFKITNLIISIGVGVTVTLLALSANGSRLFDPIADFFIKESYNLAGGNNMVNVILADFRGFDTWLEVMVLGVASLGIYSLIKLRMAEPLPLEGGSKREDQ
ncbi:Na+/H+ antiporter subunit A [Paenibacillus senegalensis]|uniref:Na+/H+ antiporter subunit A n=1 Tax=Paenibacillus senegalensis TaxID=1465766 RepID=UPI0002885EB8|nr:Na+/H+ antiporter subunit A [Paenibacillus senegalensis]